MVTTAFLNHLTCSLVLAGRYREGLEVISSAVCDAERYRLSFVVPHVLATRGACELGLRQFATSLTTLRRAQHLARRHDDVYCDMNAAALMLRLRICEGAAASGLAESPEDWRRPPSPGIRGELLACRALAFAVSGQTDAADEACAAAVAHAVQPEVRVLSAAAHAITALMRGASDTTDRLRHLMSEVVDTGNRFGLVVAYRGYPDLLRMLAIDRRNHALLRATLAEGRDIPLAADVTSTLGLPAATRASRGSLSPREAEVLELIATGMKNREIAQTLFISEVP